jgi:hypothetical protein
MIIKRGKVEILKVYEPEEKEVLDSFASEQLEKAKKADSKSKTEN